MRRDGRMKRSGAWLALMTVATVFALGTTLPARAQEDINQMVKNAKTAADHEAIASYYETQAADAKTKHEEMERLITTYSVVPRSSATSKHCDKMAQDYMDVEKQATALAEAHKKMAQQAK